MHLTLLYYTRRALESMWLTVTGDCQLAEWLGRPILKNKIFESELLLFTKVESWVKYNVCQKLISEFFEFSFTLIRQVTKFATIFQRHPNLVIVTVEWIWVYYECIFFINVFAQYIFGKCDSLVLRYTNLSTLNTGKFAVSEMSHLLWKCLLWPSGPVSWCEWST